MRTIRLNFLGKILITWGQMSRSCNLISQTPTGGLVFQSRQYESVFEFPKKVLEATKGLGGASGKKFSAHENFYM